ncbi:MAG: DUF2784 domain-containing protein [Deltaproteobacteria bacterium]|nr:DUF2784 domain-containing protein [Deltaproteobacteria bacterium]MBW2339619.1 DUF2784 domain-containing protein [Deltaproteobacteria bacterium]
MILADTIAIIHLGYVIFVILGFILILVGILLKWKWIRNLWFRVVHLGAIGGVALEALLGINCPLTVLEFELRYGATPSDGRLSFVGNIVDSILFYDAPAWLFAIIYSAFAILVAITFILAPPSRKGHSTISNQRSF